VEKTQTSDGQQRLAMAERERARILSMSRDLFAVASFEGKLLSINPAWSTHLERAESDLLTRPFSTIIHPDDLQETAKVVQTLMAGRAVHQFHVRLLKADGTPIAYAWSAVPELDPPNGTFYTVGRDISEELAAMAELESAQEALRQSQKMEAVGQLTGGLAHDLNNLLAGVSTSLQVLRTRLASGTFEGADRYLDLGMKSIERAAALTQRLLAFSRRQTLDPKPTDINRLIGGVQDLIQRALGPSIDLHAVLPAGLWVSSIDAAQFESTVLNLCLNARDAMHDGGTLTIETSNKAFDKRGGQEWGVEAGDYVRVRVSDTGSGMDAQVKARAFDPFFTTKPLGEGTGLGLSMVYGFVRQSGGNVSIESAQGVGTSVYLHFPRYVGEALGEAAVFLGEALATAQGETIVLVEDEATIRELLTEVLEDAGYRVLGAGDGAEGLSALAAAKRVDLLITDVGLPGGMNGRQVADAARSIRPHLKVLFVTGYANTAAVGNGLLPKGMDVMTKPFEVDALLAKTRELLVSPTS
jgi:PAS domain S-box-containing protein